jgi:hypothetical protein
MVCFGLVKRNRSVLAPAQSESQTGRISEQLCNLKNGPVGVTPKGNQTASIPAHPHRVPNELGAHPLPVLMNFNAVSNQSARLFGKPAMIVIGAPVNRLRSVRINRFNGVAHNVCLVVVDRIHYATTIATSRLVD